MAFLEVSSPEKRLVVYPAESLKVDNSTPITYKKWKGSLPEIFHIMDQVMKGYDGIGIAACQVGIPLPVCIVCGKKMMNLEIHSMSLEQDYLYEGCLSCPGERINIARPKEIVVSYLDHKGRKVERKRLKGIEARCFLHEFDHIRGKLIKDYSAN